MGVAALCEAHGRHICPSCRGADTPFPSATAVVDAEADVLEAAIAMRHTLTPASLERLHQAVDALEDLFADLTETR